MLHIRLASTTYACIVILQLLQDDIGTLHDAAWHTGNLRHMDTEGVLTASRLQLAQEDNLAIHLLHAHIEILDARKVLLHLVELMIVGSEEGASLRLLVLMQILHDGPGDADTIIGRCTTPQLIEEYQGARRHII